jgi:hypothetical protein
MGYPVNYWKGSFGHEQDQREDDRATRDRLERQSPRMVTSRVDMVGRLNAIARADAARRAPGVEALNAIRKAAQQNSSSENYGYQQFEKLAEEAFNRLHPGSRLSRASDFDFRSGEPGARGSRFEQSGKYDPPRRVGIVADAAGRLRGDGRAERTGETDVNDGSDHWASGRVTPIDAEWMLEAARMLIEAVRSRKFGQSRV